MIILLKILGTILLAALAGWTYRLGGAASAHARYLRQVGVGIAVTGTLVIWFGWNWWSLLCLGTAFIESTYFKNKGSEAVWWNWCLVGVACTLVPLPFLIADGHHWIGFFWRSIFLIPAITLIGTFVGDVDWSEGLRGAVQILSLFLLFIH